MQMTYRKKRIDVCGGLTETMAMTGQTTESLQNFRKITAGSNRKFGLTLGIIAILFSIGSALVRHQPPRLWLAGLGAFLVVLALVTPSWLGPLNRLWFRFGLLLARVTNPIVMGILFFGVMTPMAWFVRLRGQDLLRLKRDSAAASYWIDRETAPTPLEKQF
jgi:hypothetical protein